MRLPERVRPAGDGTNGARTETANLKSGSTLPERIDRFAHDALLEVMLDAERRWWLKRAEDFERAKPRPGEYAGGATPADLSAQWRRLDAMARACRARAHVSPVEHIREDVANVLREAS